MWMICCGSTHDNFIPWWQLCMLIIGQPDTMLTDLRRSKESRKLSALSMEILVSGDNHNVSNLVFSNCMSGCLAEVQDTARSLFHYSPSPHFLMKQPSPVGLSCHCLMQPSGSQYLHKFCSLSPLALQHHTKTNNALFHEEWPFKLVHAASFSSSRRITALWGNLRRL